jgi:hypothetical protein
MEVKARRNSGICVQISEPPLSGEVSTREEIPRTHTLMSGDQLFDSSSCQNSSHLPPFFALPLNEKPDLRTRTLGLRS